MVVSIGRCGGMYVEVPHGAAWSVLRKPFAADSLASFFAAGQRCPVSSIDALPCLLRNLMESPMLQFTRHTKDGSQSVTCSPDHLVIAGWAARDEAAVKHHIDELAAIGVPPPSSVPLFYRAAANLLSQSGKIEVLGPDSSGEVEPVLISMDGGLWLTIGSDHTDRKAETLGVALSKQLCPKPVGADLWRLEDVTPHWDVLEMRSFITIAGKRELYQEGALGTLRPPADLVSRYAQEGSLPAGTVMFGGTLGAIGGVRVADRFEMELTDPVLGRTIKHAYDIQPLAVVS
jgi:hypothetical protein